MFMQRENGHCFGPDPREKLLCEFINKLQTIQHFLKRKKKPNKQTKHASLQTNESFESMMCCVLLCFF